MATYATPDQLRQPAWGLPARALQNLEDADLQQALQAASAQIDTYLRSQYTLPISDSGALQVLGVAACHIGAWFVLSGRGFDPTKGSDEAVRMRYTDAIKWLNQLASGNVTLLDRPSGDSDGDIDGVIVESSDGRGF